MKAGILLDMHGCPNRCRHCWLGVHENPRMSVKDLKWLANEFRQYTRDGNTFFSELEFQTWYREPDFSDDYRELRQVAGELSDVQSPHWELASVWRIVRDPDYIRWLKELGLGVIQVTLYGPEETTDYFTRRKGAYSDTLKAIDIMLEHGIAPRIQVFPFTDTIDDIHALCNELTDMKIEERVRDIGKDFTCFLNISFTPMGGGFNLLDTRLRKGDLEKLPQYLRDKTREFREAGGLPATLLTEAELLPSLLEDDNPLCDDTDFPAFNIDEDYNTYPTCGEITEWWNLGNVRIDGVNTIMDNYLNRTTPGMKMNFEMPVSYFAKKYGNPESDVLWGKTDLVHKWMRQECMAGLE